MATEVAVMSLTAREQQALRAIEGRLAGSDPALASRLAAFTRLTSGAKMPAREKTRRGSWRAMLLLCLTMAVAEGIVIALAVAALSA
jgi:anti-sigma-K factor RskA